MAGRPQGFTYLAVLLWLAIASAALLAVAQVEHTVTRRAQERELLYVGGRFRHAIERYYQTNRRYPLRLADLLRDDRQPGIVRHLRKIHVDPMTGRADWGVVQLGDGQIVGVFSQSDAKPMKQDNFGPQDRFDGKQRYADWRFVASMRGSLPASAAGRPGNPLGAGTPAPTFPAFPAPNRSLPPPAVTPSVVPPFSLSSR